MESNTGRCWFSWKLNKWQNVNMIVSAFNSQEVLGGPQKSETQKKNVPRPSLHVQTSITG